MATIADLRSALILDPPVPGRELCRRLGGIDRATLLRLVRRIDDEVLRLGKARHSVREGSGGLFRYAHWRHHRSFKSEVLHVTALEGCL